MRNPTWRRWSAAAAATAGLLSLAGCSTSGVSATEPSATPTSASASSTPEVPPLERYWDNVTEYVQATHNSNFKTAFRLAQEGSPAWKYAQHQSNADRAYTLGGISADDTKYSFSIDEDKHEIKVSTNDGLSYLWRDFKISEDGNLISWTGRSGPVADVLWHKDAESVAFGAKFTLVSAYRANSGALVAVVKVRTGGTEVDVQPPAFASQNGLVHEAGHWSNSGTLPARSTGLYAYSFEDTKFGGSLRFTIYDSWYNEVPVTLPVR